MDPLSRTKTIRMILTAIALCRFLDHVTGSLELRLDQLSPGMWPLDVRRWISHPTKGLKPPTWFRYNIELYWDYFDRPSGIPQTQMLGGKSIHQFFRESRLDERRGIVRLVR
jgi:hypothetical protein